MSHADNPKILNRLRRAQGHLGTIVTMVEEGRDVPAIAQQLQAVLKALEKAKSMLILDHIDHHLEDIAGPVPRETRQVLESFRELTKYL